jgi:predicted dehydrogenase
MPSLAVVGAGSAGRRHISNLRALGCQVDCFDVAVAPGVQPAAALDLAAYEAVVIATPWDTHLPYVGAAIQSKTPFYVEKPLGSLEQIPRWRELAEMDLPVNQVGYQLRFHWRYRAMRQLVPNPTGGSFVCDFNMATWPGRAYGPAKLEASHELDLALDCGLEAEAAFLCDGFDYYRSWHISDDTATAEAAFSSPEALGNKMYLDAMAHVLAHVKDGTPTICPLADGLRVLEALA